MNTITGQLLAMGELPYKSFQSKLMPTVNPESVIGVRTPALRKLAKELYATKAAEEFLKSLPHRFYEENNMHGLLIEKIRDYDLCIQELERFLPYVDNWATCDSITPKIFTKHKHRLKMQIKKWLCSSHPYTVRFAIRMLMVFYLDEDYSVEYSDMVGAVESDEYYVKMMVAWYFATALAKQYESAVVYLEKEILPRWTHNKTIQKAIESFRISDSKKEYLRTLKRVQ